MMKIYNTSYYIYSTSLLSPKMTVIKYFGIIDYIIMFPRFCRPKKLQFVRETKDVILTEKQALKMK